MNTTKKTTKKTGKETITITITRRSIVGFGYTSAVENDERGNWRVCETVVPDHTGTIAQVQRGIESDRTLRSFQSGTYYSTAWFVRFCGRWRKINTSKSMYLPQNLLDEAHPDDNKKYYLDSVNVEIE